MKTNKIASFRLLFLVISIILGISSTTIFLKPSSLNFSFVFWGIIAGFLTWFVLIGIEKLLKNLDLRSFNIAIFGIFFGYLMGKGLSLIVYSVHNSIVENSYFIKMSTPLYFLIFLISIYVSTILVAKFADEISISIPFIKFSALTQKKKNILIDSSALSDQRLIDLANSGLLDNQLILPRFIIKELYTQSESQEEEIKIKAQKSLETIKNLEEMPNLELQISDINFFEIKEHLNKLLRLARILNANIMSSDASKTNIPFFEGIKFINLNSLSNALKPLMSGGEKMKIKIQRTGKEPMQGVGYLEDGSMVVVNGGGDLVGEMVDVIVLSVKHTSSGRIVFCNLAEDFVETSSLS